MNAVERPVVTYLSEEDSRLAAAHFDPVRTVGDALIRHTRGGIDGPPQPLAVLGYVRDPANAGPARRGMVLLFDRSSGRLYSAIAAGYLTALRAAAVTVIATRHLARGDLIVAGIVGAGLAGDAHAELIARSFAGLATIAIYDKAPGRARELSDGLTETLAGHGVAVNAAGTIQDALLGADLIILTRQSYVEQSWLMPGSLVICHTQDEAADDLWRPDAPLVLNDAALGAVVLGTHPGRQRHKDIVVVCTAGLAAQDIALAVAMHEVAQRTGLGMRLRE